MEAENIFTECRASLVAVRFGTGDDRVTESLSRIFCDGRNYVVMRVSKTLTRTPSCSGRIVSRTPRNYEVTSNRRLVAFLFKSVFLGTTGWQPRRHSRIAAARRRSRRRPCGAGREFRRGSSLELREWVGAEEVVGGSGCAGLAAAFQRIAKAEDEDAPHQPAGDVPEDGRPHGIVDAGVGSAAKDRGGMLRAPPADRHVADRNVDGRE